MLFRSELQNSIQIPLDVLKKEWNQLDVNKNIVVFCQSGIRSKKAVEILKINHFKNAQSVIGGVLAIQKIDKETFVVF